MITIERAVWLNDLSNAYIITSIGSFSPTDKATGLVMALRKEDGSSQILLYDLQRPMHTTFDDINGDGRFDFG